MEIDGSKIEPVDCISFGSPCQDLSVAGLRKGLKHMDNGDDETTRSGLFMEAIRIIKEMREHELEQLRRSGRTDEPVRPRFALWENVPGAFSSNQGEDFRVVLEELIHIVEPTFDVPRCKKWAKSGLIIGDNWSIAWRTLDAQYWGVPQRRKRIALVMDLADRCAGEILFEQTCVSGNSDESIKTWKGVARNPEESIGECDSYTLKIRGGERHICRPNGWEDQGSRKGRIDSRQSFGNIGSTPRPNTFQVVRED